MNYDESIAIIDYLNQRLRPSRWHLWPNMTWEKVERIYRRLMALENQK